MSLLQRTRAPSSQGGLGVALTFFTLLFVILMGRLFYLQILRGEDYKERARISFIARERIPARRGRILDRNDVVLADNTPVYRLTLVPHYVAGEVRERVLEQLSVVLGMTAAERLSIDAKIAAAMENHKAWEPLLIRRDLVGGACPYDGASLELAERPSHELSCRECGLTHSPIASDATFCPFDRKRLAWDRDHLHATCPRCRRSFVSTPVCPHDGHLLDVVENNLRCPTCERTFTNQVATLGTLLHSLPGVDLATELRRTYPLRYEAAHVVGYMNRVTAEDREAAPGTYGLTDFIGRRGVERAFEDALRGEAGESLYIKDSGGRRREAHELGSLVDDVEFRPAVRGDDVRLTIDLRLQREVRRAFRYHKSGAAVAIDPRTGEVLAAYSKPGFDPNQWSGRLTQRVWDETTSNPYAPLLDKAVTPYAPGSVYKIVTATAGLADGVITPDLTINCPGYYDFAGRRFHCHNRAGHGPQRLVDAIKHSCDVYFYRVGQIIGMDALARYGQLFGFGEPTGVGVDERSGRVPSKTWHEEHTQLGWQPGLTLSTAIGQGSLTASPLQVARAFAALLGGGRLLKLHLVRDLRDAAGDVVKTYVPELTRDLSEHGARPEHLALVREGLVRVINDPDGTASDVAMDEVVFGGKTGTAEAAQRRVGADPELARWLREDHAWFAGYAPAEDPQILVVVFVEHGGGGSKVAAPIAQRVVRAWLRLGLYEPPAPEAGDEDAPALHGDDVDPTGRDFPADPDLPSGADDIDDAGEAR